MTVQQIYRKCKESDVTELYQLICILEQTALPYEAFHAIYCDQLDDPRYDGIVCESDRHIIGFIHLRLEDQLHHAGKIAEIMELIVAENKRGQGIGNELLQRGCLAARQAGCIQVEVSSHHRRSDAHRFYVRNGFQNHHKKFTQKL